MTPAELKWKAKMVAPDPWMLAIGAIVWEGILQGLSWDLVKASAMAGLRLLRSRGLAPEEKKVPTAKSTRRARSLEFRWEILGAGGKPLSTSCFASRSRPKRIHTLRDCRSCARQNGSNCERSINALHANLLAGSITSRSA